MRAQICFFASIAFSFIAWGVVVGRARRRTPQHRTSIKVK
jgi:hypothetical protein